MVDRILQVIKSEIFRNRLASVNANYSNLKQENSIRNLILEIFNEDSSLNQFTHRAFAEHPRYKGSRVDLSIVEKLNPSDPFLVELKYQYSGDYNGMSQYEQVIQNDFQRTIFNKQTDMFILIIADWKRADKEEYDGTWGISSNLSRFLNDQDNSLWHKNIMNLLGKFNETIDCFDVVVTVPYVTNYRFYALTRKRE